VASAQTGIISKMFWIACRRLETDLDVDTNLRLIHLNEEYPNVNLTKISLEMAEEYDAEILAEISKRAFESDVECGAPEPGGPPGYDSPRATAGNIKYTDYYKIMLEYMTIGAILVCPREENHAEICGLFVDPPFQNNGVATKAFDLIYEKYPENEVWTLGTPEWNVRTKHFFEKLGFVQIGWTKDPEWKGRWYQKKMDPEKKFEMTKLKALKDGMRKIVVEGTIIEKGFARQVRGRRSREPLLVANATLEDETGSVVLVLWNEQIRSVSVGDKVRIENGYMSSYRGIKQLNIGRGGRLVFLDPNIH
jgi:N-acetylglutamate synthase-like GNAT family acetyltransferase